MELKTNLAYFQTQRFLLATRLLFAIVAGVFAGAPVAAQIPEFRAEIRSELEPLPGQSASHFLTFPTQKGYLYVVERSGDLQEWEAAHWHYSWAQSAADPSTWAMVNMQVPGVYNVAGSPAIEPAVKGFHFIISRQPSGVTPPWTRVSFWAPDARVINGVTRSGMVTVVLADDWRMADVTAPGAQVPGLLPGGILDSTSRLVEPSTDPAYPEPFYVEISAWDVLGINESSMGVITPLENLSEVQAGILRKLTLSKSRIHYLLANEPPLSAAIGAPVDGEKQYLRVRQYTVDTDGDGLADHEEARLGSSILSDDTDGDGVSDYFEVMAEMDPIDPADNDADLDGVVNGEDAVPWDSNITWEPTPDNKYGVINLGGGTAAAVTDSGLVAVSQASAPPYFDRLLRLLGPPGARDVITATGHINGDSTKTEARFLGVSDTGEVLLQARHQRSISPFPGQPTQTLNQRRLYVWRASGNSQTISALKPLAGDAPDYDWKIASSPQASNMGASVPAPMALQWHDHNTSWGHISAAGQIFIDRQIAQTLVNPALSPPPPLRTGYCSGLVWANSGASPATLSSFLPSLSSVLYYQTAGNPLPARARNLITSGSRGGVIAFDHFEYLAGSADSNPWRTTARSYHPSGSGSGVRLFPGLTGGQVAGVCDMPPREASPSAATPELERGFARSPGPLALRRDGLLYYAPAAPGADWVAFKNRLTREKGGVPWTPILLPDGAGGQDRRAFMNLAGQFLAHDSTGPELWQNGRVRRLWDMAAGWPSGWSSANLQAYDLSASGVVAGVHRVSNTNTAWLAIPFTFDGPATVEAGGDTYVSVSVPGELRHMGQIRLAVHRNGTELPNTILQQNVPETGTLAIRVNTAAAPGQAPLLTDVYTISARLMTTPAMGAAVFSDPITLLPGPPASITVDVPAAGSVVADNYGRHLVTITVKDRFGYPVSSDTPISVLPKWTRSLRLTGGVEMVRNQVTGLMEQRPPLEGATQPVDWEPTGTTYLPVNGEVKFEMRASHWNRPEFRVAAGQLYHEFTLDLADVSGTLTPSHSIRRTGGAPADTDTLVTLDLKQTGGVAVADGTPSVWTVSRRDPVGYRQQPDDLVITRPVINGLVSIPVSALGASTGTCVVTCTVATKLFHTSIQFIRPGDQSFTVEASAPVLAGDKKPVWNAAASQWQTTHYQQVSGGYTGGIQVPAGAVGTITGPSGRQYRITSSLSQQLGLIDPAATPLLADQWSGSRAASSITVTANSSGTATFHYFSLGNLSAGRGERAYIEVRDLITNQEDSQPVAMVPLTVGGYFTDAVAGFLGQDTQSGYGVAMGVVGGILFIGDLGSLAKNAWRMAGWSDKKANWLEAALSSLGVGTSVVSVISGGSLTGLDAIVSASKALISHIPELVELVYHGLKNAISNGLDVVAVHGVDMVKAAASSPPMLTLLSHVRISTLDDVLHYEEALRKVGDNFTNVVSSGVQAGSYSVKVYNASAQVIALLGDDVMAALKNLPAAEGEAAVKGVMDVLNVIDSAGTTAKATAADLLRVLTNDAILQAPKGIASSYTVAKLMTELGAISRVADQAGMLELMKALKSRTRNAALGNRYALSVAADIVARGGVQGVGKIKYVSKLIGTRFRKGWTDIDLVVKETVGGVETAVYYQIKSSVPAATKNFGKMKEWVAKAVKDYKNTYGAGSTPRIRYVAPGDIPPNFGQWKLRLETAYSQDGLFIEWLNPNIPFP